MEDKWRPWRSGSTVISLLARGWIAGEDEEESACKRDEGERITLHGSGAHTDTCYRVILNFIFIGKVNGYLDAYFLVF
jgi:hypothetical protein